MQLLYCIAANSTTKHASHGRLGFLRLLIRAVATYLGVSCPRPINGNQYSHG